MTLEWAPPLDPGGRSDITYNAVCRRCPWALSHCEACGSGTRFVPQQTSLVQASLLVANLLAHMNYSFWIEAVNGVSNLSPEPRSAAVVNITTNQAGRRSSPGDPIDSPTPSHYFFWLFLPTRTWAGNLFAYRKAGLILRIPRKTQRQSSVVGHKPGF